MDTYISYEIYTQDKLYLQTTRISTDTLREQKFLGIFMWQECSFKTI